MQADRYERAHTTCQSLKPEPEDCDDVRGYWFYGAPGVGKSTFVRDWARSIDKTLYTKTNSNWWNMYSDQEFILFDDVDRFCKQHGHGLKEWADRFKCKVEPKNSFIWLRHEYFVVTSNYRIRDIWKDDEILCLALERRFRFIDYEFMVANFWGSKYVDERVPPLKVPPLKVRTQ